MRSQHILHAQMTPVPDSLVLRAIMSVTINSVVSYSHNFTGFYLLGGGGGGGKILPQTLQLPPPPPKKKFLAIKLN